MKINPSLSQFSNKTSQIIGFILLFFTLFSTSVLAKAPQINEPENFSPLLNSTTLIAHQRVFVDRYGRRYVFNRYGRRIYRYPSRYGRRIYRYPSRYGRRIYRYPTGRVRYDREGRRIFIDRYGRHYVFNRYGRRLYL